MYARIEIRKHLRAQLSAYAYTHASTRENYARTPIRTHLRAQLRADANTHAILRETKRERIYS